MLRLRHAGALLLLTTLGLAMTTMAAAAVPTRTQVIQRVNQAVAFYKANGREKALVQLNRSNGPFSQGLDYVDVHDLNGVCVAHPRSPDAVGVSHLDMPDAQGRPILRQIIEAAQTQEDGWIEYEFQNANSGVIARRIAYWVVHDGLIFKARTDQG